LKATRATRAHQGNILRLAFPSDPSIHPFCGALALAVLVGITYFLAARLSLALLTKPDGVAVFWPAAGIASGILIALGPAARLPVAAGVMAATVAANLLGDRNLGGAIVFAVCNAGEAIIVARLVERHFGLGFGLDTFRRVLGFFLVIGIATAISGIGGTAGFVLFHSAEAPVLAIWLNWFASDALGIITVAPLVIGFARTAHDLPEIRELLEGFATLAVLALVSAIGFGSPADHWFTILPLALALPLLLWPAAYCRPVFAAAAIFIVALAIVWTITFGNGRLGNPNLPLADRVNAARVSLLAISWCGLVLGALFAERRRHEATIKDSNDRLQLALDGAVLGVWSVDSKTGRFENDARDRWIHGHDPESPPRTVAEARPFIHPDDLPNLDAAFVESRRTGSSFSAEYRLAPAASHGRGGQEHWIAVEGTVVRSADRHSARLLGITRDITKRKQIEEKSQKSERALRELLGALPVAIYTTDAAGCITYCNQGAVDLWGTSPHLGKDRWWELGRLYHPDGTPMKLKDCPTEIALKQGKVVRGREAIIERSDGSCIPIIPYPTPLRDEAGVIVGVVSMTVDITERKKAERVLAERNTQLALAGKIALVGSYTFDISSETVQVSRGYAAIHGLPEGTVEINRRDWRSRVHPQDLPRLDDHLQQAFANRRGDHYCEYRIVRSGGEIRWIESRSLISYDRDGAAQRIVGVHIDVTERKQAEAMLTESKARLADALAAGQVMAFEWDAATGKSQRSENAAHIIGFEHGMTGSRRNDFLKRVHPDDSERFKAHLRELRPGNPSYALSFRFCCPDGRQVWLEETARGDFDAAGRLLRVKGLTRNITERKVLEEHKNVLIAELDHRVKNVLSLVSVISSRTQETSSSMADFVTALDGRIRSMATTHELLSHRHWQGIPLADLVRRELAPYATASNTRVEGSDDILSAEAGQALAMVFHELATNAAKFGALSAADGRVWVRWTHKRNGHARSWLSIHWEERGGPSVVPQTRSGYGTSVIRDLIPYELDGTVDLVHAPDGVRCRLEMPAHWLNGSNPPSILSTNRGLRDYSMEGGQQF
jgi:PAS domain S-box-containing protein